MTKILRRLGERWINYCKMVCNDYKSVFIDVVKTSRSNPFRTTAILATFMGLRYAHKSNPSESDFMDYIIEKRLQMALVPIRSHNINADRTIRQLSTHINTGRLDYYDLFFFSVLMRRDYGEELRIHYSVDPNMKDWWWKKIPINFIDIGAFGRWFIIERGFIDYDVNEDEFDGDKLKMYT